MNVTTVGIALQGGELGSGLIGIVEEHPLLEFCGVARSQPDLFRLLERFHPAVLLISPTILEEMDGGIDHDAAALLSAPLSFLLSGPEISWSQEKLSAMLGLPLQYCGLISRDISGGEDLLRIIKPKLDLYTFGEIPRLSTLNKQGSKIGSNGLIAVTGSKGGVGTTLLSCSLAAVLASTGRRVLLMDMDSDLSQLLHIKPKEDGKTIGDLLPLAEEMSWDLVRVSIHRHQAGFHLLPYGHRHDELSRPSGMVKESFLRNVLFLFDTVVLDFPSPLRGDFTRLLPHDPLVLLVSLPDTLSANCARKVAQLLRRAGLDRSRLQLIVNRCGNHHTLRPGELANAVGLDLAATVPQDERSGMDFSELGEIPRENSPLGRASADLARALGVDPGGTGEPAPLRRFKAFCRRNEDELLRGERH